MSFRWSALSANWRAAALLGLVSSTFSTIVSTLTADRIGRDAIVDWMVVAVIPARDAALHIHPPAWVILTGILFHQWADFSWAVVFFGLLGRWTARLGPWTILAVAVVWSVFTSSLEWLFLVPVIPFRQPIFTLEQTYWIGFLVHLTSASMYPLFPWIRDRVAGVRPSPNRRFAAGWATLAVAGIAVLSVGEALGLTGREAPWIGRDPAYDQTFMRRMSSHHAQGVQLALLGAERARDPHLRALAKLMAASQSGENRIFRQWWRSWFPDILPPASASECLTMPGMLTPAEMITAQNTRGPGFDALFVRLMTRHHQGAIAMADDALVRAGDPRLKVMAHAIRHEQTGEIALMRHVPPGLPAVRVAVSSLLRPPALTGPDPSNREQP